MKSQLSLCLLLALFSSFFFSSSVANNFYLNWVMNPTEKYNDWAGRNRFLVNDTITFKLKQGSDSVLEVKKDDYYNCNTNNPIKILNSGASVFKFDRSGPFFFIDGSKEICEKEQTLIVVVLAIRPKTHPTIPKTPAPVVSQPPKSSSSSPSPLAQSPSPSLNPPSPLSHSPSPFSKSPSPVTHSPSPIPESTPACSPAPMNSTTPVGTSAKSSGEPVSSPDSSASADEKSPPAPSKSASTALTPASTTLFAASLLIGVAIGIAPLGV